MKDLSKFDADQFIADSEVVRFASGAAIQSGLQRHNLTKHAANLYPKLNKVAELINVSRYALLGEKSDYEFNALDKKNHCVIFDHVVILNCLHLVAHGTKTVDTYCDNIYIIDQNPPSDT